MRIVNMDLDEDFLARFFDLTGDKIPDTITIVSLKRQVLNIKERFRTILADSNGASASVNTIEDSEELAYTNIKTNTVLFIDNLGVIAYQAQMILSKLGLKTIVAKDVSGALSMFEDKDFDVILMDLLIPTEREGFILLAELKRIARQKGVNPVIGVMSANNKKELKSEALERGAAFHLEKTSSWQKRLEDIMKDYINED